MTGDPPHIRLESLEHAVGGAFPGHDEHWTVVLLFRNGRSLVKQQLVEMDNLSRKKLMANLHVLAGYERVRNSNIARPWRKGSKVWEVKARDWRVMYFYFASERKIVLTNMVNKNAGEKAQDRAFEICDKLKEETLHSRTKKN